LGPPQTSDVVLMWNVLAPHELSTGAQRTPLSEEGGRREGGRREGREREGSAKPLLTEQSSSVRRSRSSVVVVIALLLCVCVWRWLRGTREVWQSAHLPPLPSNDSNHQRK
jgi:hypothetical protein